MKVYTISNRDVMSLRDIQVSFLLNGSMVVVVQVEVMTDFTDNYSIVDLEKFSQSALERIARICAGWVNDKFCYPFEVDGPSPA